MWTKKEAAFVLIKFSGKGKLRFTFPIALFIFIEILDELNDLFKIINYIFPKQCKALKQKVLTNKEVISFKDIVIVSHQLFKGLNQIKGMTLVEVHTDEIYIKISVM